MKFDIKPSKAAAIVGIILASAFVLIAIVSPESLDWILRPGEERSDRIKQAMERQKTGGGNDKSDTPLKRDGAINSGAITPTPSPEESIQPSEIETRGIGRSARVECISRDRVVRILGSSEEAREGRVFGISLTPDGGQIMVEYRKKTFLGIGSGQHQIQGILQRGLRDRFPDRLIKSVRVQSDGNKTVRQGQQIVNVEVLKIVTLQAGCRWP